MKFSTCSMIASTLVFVTLSAPALAADNNTVAAKATSTNVALVGVDDDSIVPDISASTTNEYKCELNDALTIYTNQIDDNRVALRWKNKLYGMKRVETTTGANRFENKKAGLVWIGIPTKGMLLDSIRGQQLTNECVTGNN